MEMLNPLRPLVSVVVTTYFSENYLSRCLESIKNQTYSNIELIIVDSFSSDRSLDIARKFTNRVFAIEATERSAKRNFGAFQGAGKYVFIVDSDMILGTNVVESCIEKMENNFQLRAIVIPELSVGESFWAKCKSLERSFYHGIEWMEAARFFDRDVFYQVGGYDESNTGSEDYDLAQRVQEKHSIRAIGRISDFISQNEVHLSLLDSCRKKFYYAKSFPKYAVNSANCQIFRKQSSLLLRYKIFFSQPKKLFKNPLLGLGVLWMKTAEFVAGGTGYFLALVFGKTTKN